MIQGILVNSVIRRSSLYGLIPQWHPRSGLQARVDGHGHRLMATGRPRKLLDILQV